MKKILFLFIAALALTFTACDPMSDINDEIDAKQEVQDKNDLYLSGLEIAPEAYTLTDEDYELSSNENVSKYKNFSASALPKDYLPEILNQKFSGEDAQSMLVTYDYYSRPVVDEANAYELSDADYESMGQSYPNFSDEDEAEALIAKLLDRIAYAQEEGMEKTVQYTLFSTREDRFIRVNADGTSEEVGYTPDAVEVTDEIYEATGNGKYKNFYKIDDALEDLAKYAVDSGVSLPVTYEALVYLNYMDEFAVYYYNGMNWEVKQSVMAVSEPLNFALNSEDITQSYWWADPAIKITLTADDYDSNDDTERYDNFDLRSGKTPGAIGYNIENGVEVANPQLELMVEMIGDMLDLNHGAVENQQYLVTYAYYDGSSGTSSVRVIKVNGEWIDYITYVNKGN